MCTAVQGLKVATVHLRRGKSGEQQALCGTLSGLNDVSACLAAQNTTAGGGPTATGLCSVNVCLVVLREQGGYCCIRFFFNVFV